ncbi:MAG: TRAM domain-containing protein [Ktedonobacterales bacterium]|nr:TRAM domain-containing protein [Ktedonobacterales bacterium]
MSGRFVARVATFVVAAGAAVGVGYNLSRRHPSTTQWEFIVGIALISGFLAVALIPFLIIAPYHWVRDQIRKAEVSDLIAAAIGLVIGLVIAALLAIPLAQLTFWHLGQWLPTLGALLFAYLGIATAVLRKDDFGRLATVATASRAARRAATREEREREERERDDRERDDREDHEEHEERGKLRDRIGGRKGGKHSDKILVDTSAIIDGRIADISQTGFISSALIVPRFVLEELQHIADSADSLRRNRGRRGLEILQRLQKDNQVPVEISDADPENTPEVDAKLVKLARQWHCLIITNDFNLNRVAELQGVKVLNINELAHAVKPILLPGEEMAVTIMQDGKEAGQGVGYLDDGTMIVVEGGKSFMGTTLDVTVTRVLQTVAGRMIFAHPKQHAGNVPIRRTGTA